ncbi:MAG: gamma-glutamyl-phosphate reductase, partial [Synergistaceae bacterium]|nr:gamma-glutamyl-phosphate reductase [Synergistaceae bacterium]
MSWKEDLDARGKKARDAARRLATTSTEVKDAALRAMAKELRRNEAAILEQNRLDLDDGKAAGLTNALLDRL